MPRKKANTEDNLKLAERIKQIHRLAVKIGVFYIAMSIFGFFVPFGFLPKAGGRIRGEFSRTLPEQIGVLAYIIIMIAIIIALILSVAHLYRYFDLKKDILEKYKTSFLTKITDFIPLGDDLGNQVYRIWLTPNPYGLKKIELNQQNMIGFPSIGSNANVEITCNAYFPLRIEIKNQESQLVHDALVDKALVEAEEVLKKHRNQ